MSAESAPPTLEDDASGPPDLQKGAIAEREDGDGGDDGGDDINNEPIANLTLEDIIESRSDRGIPVARFVDDVSRFAESFRPVPATAEHMIGAYNQLHAKYRQYESAFRQKMERLQDKIPELDRSLALVRHLQQKQQQAQQQKKDDPTSPSSLAVCAVRYSLADSVYGRAEVDASDGVVHLWLGANVMLEYTYVDALRFLEDNRSAAARDVLQLRDDLGLVRDQIVTCEVTMSRIYNWDVRRRREQQQQAAAAAAKASAAVVGAAAAGS